MSVASSNKARGEQPAFLLLILLTVLLTPTWGQSPLIDSLKNVVQKDSLNVNALILLCKNVRATNPQEAEQYGLKALRASQKRGVFTAIDSALYEMASVSYVQGKLDAANQYLTERINLELEKKDSLNLARSYNFLGGIQNEQGKKVDALETFITGKNMADKLLDPKLRYSFCYNLALYYHDDREKALKYRLEAYELSKQLNDYPQAYRRMAEITSVLANEYFLQKDFVTARKFLDEALGITKNRKLFVSEAFCYGTLSEIFRAEKNYDSAIYYVKKAIDLKTTVGDRTRLHDSYGLLGEIYLEQKNYKEAVPNLSKAVELTREMKSLFFQYRWLPTLAKAYAGLGDKEMAYQTMAEYQALSDSVLNEEKVKAIAKLETQYETAKKQQEIESLKKEQELQGLVNRNQKIIFACIAILLIMSGLVYYFRAKAKEQENIRLTEKVDAQNRELSTISLLVSKKNEALLGIKEKLNGTGNGHQENDLKSIVKDIDREIDFDADWDTFKYHFEKVHQGFFQKLTEVVPSLSNKEQRYCAYFKSNLSTKEIAQLTNTSVRGVQQARYRINQKFTEINTSLSEFIQRN